MKKISKFTKYLGAHKAVSIIVVLILLGGGYVTYKKAFAKAAIPQYTLSPARLGSIRQTITGSGQVSSENQLDVTSEVSGKILSIQAVVGQHVKAGDVLATLDSHDALVSLQNAQISYAKLVKSADPGDITNAENNVVKSYSDGYNTVASTFIQLPSIISGLNDLFYNRTNYLYDGGATGLSETGKDYRLTAARSFDKVNNDYAAILLTYGKLTKTSPQTQVEEMITETHAFMQKLSETLKLTQAAVTFISTSQPGYSQNAATTAASNVSSWSSEVNSDVSSLLSAKNSIVSTLDSLHNLNKGADALDVQSQQLSLEQAQQTYRKYTVRAPFEGIVGKIPVSVYGQASGSTVIATIIGDQKNAVISLNEVDAAKVAAGQKVTLTFDAIDGLNATGTVRSVDQVGTVSQGVVSYSVKIGIDTSDIRIKPGMSVNTSIITKEKNNVLVVPTAAVKTLGNRKYVQVLSLGMNGGMASTTRRYTTEGEMASTTMASSTVRRNFNTGAGTGAGFTISSATPPQQVTVTTGDSDDTNIEILSGLTAGQMVVTRTVTTGASTATAPNILSSIGGNRAGGAGAVRTTGAPTGAVRATFTR